MNERTRRVWAAVEANALGYGGISAVAVATGLSRNTIAAGIEELRGIDPYSIERRKGRVETGLGDRCEWMDHGGQ